MSSQTSSALKSYARTVQPLVREQQPGKYDIPAKPYFTAPAPHLLEEICRLTEDLELLEPEYRRDMLQRIRGHAWGTAVYGEYPAPPDVEAQKLIIGKGGYYFKITTQNTGIYLIWHNRLRNIFGFWAPDKDTLFLAMNLIRSRLVKIIVHVLPEKRQAALYAVHLPVPLPICQTPPPALEPITPPPLIRSVSSFRTGSMLYPTAEPISRSPSPEPSLRTESCRANYPFSRSPSSFESGPVTYPSYEEAGAAASLEFCKPRHPMQRTASIIAVEEEPEVDPMEYKCFRTGSMLYPTHLAEGQRDCSLERTCSLKPCPEDDVLDTRSY